MSILDRIFRKASIPHRGSLYAGGSIPADFTRQDYLQSYATIGWWHAVVFRIALGLSEVKWTLFDVTNRDKPKQIYDHSLLSFLHLINPFQTSEEFIALDTIYMECVGESFWILNNNALGEPGEAILAYPQKMSVVPDKAFPFVKGYVYGNGPDAVPLDVNEVIHFKFPNPQNQYRGLGQAQPIGVNLDAEKNSDKWVNQFFYNSARPDGVIQFDYTLSDEQFDKLKRQWSERHQGVSKAHSVGLLEGGGKYVQIQNSVKDMDFPNLKLKNRDIILGVEGMPQSVMGISENVNKANAEAGDYTFARWIVKPRLDWKLAKLQEQLVPKFRNSKNLQLGYEEVVPETIDQKRELAESGMRAGYLTINEARKLRGLDALPDGDVLLIPLNLIPTPIKDLAKPPPAPESAPKEPPEEEVQEYYKGGEGSGNFGHEGRPGEVGGSGGGGGGGGTYDDRISQIKRDAPSNWDKDKNREGAYTRTVRYGDTNQYYNSATVFTSRQRDTEELPFGLIKQGVFPTSLGGNSISSREYHKTASSAFNSGNRFLEDKKEYGKKSLTPDQKRIHWEAYAKKTERQEEVFKRVFDAHLTEQKNQIIEQITKGGNLDESIFNDERVAKKFEPAIELVYHSSFEDAI